MKSDIAQCAISAFTPVIFKAAPHIRGAHQTESPTDFYADDP